MSEKRGNFKGRKAQVTIFIIIGVIILFGAGTVIYLRQTGVGPAAFIQPETPPVERYIEACLEKTARDALIAIGSQGGFITVPDDIALNPTRHVTLVPGVPSDLAPKVPYWYWEGQTEVPSLQYMEKEVEYYIDNNLDMCIQDFAGFEEEYLITPRSDFESSVVFADQDTVVGLDWDIEIQPRGGELTKKDQFMVNLDVKVKKMYQLARELLKAENEKMFFEEMTIDLMASHPPDKIPFDGLKLTCGKEMWHISKVKENLIEALEPAVMGIRFRDTDHPPFLEDEDAYIRVHQAVKEFKESEEFVPLQLPEDVPEDAYIYFQYYFNFTDKDYSDLKVTSNFRKEWGLNLMVTPSQYGLMKSGVQDLKSRILSFLCLNMYHFVYDLYYPVMISVSDPDAFRGEGYVFRYAFPVQIYHNRGDRNPQPAIEYNPSEFDLDFCDYYGREEHTIRAVDKVTNAELSRVNLTYNCFTASCKLGSTRTNNQHLQWTGNFPDGCTGAIIRASKDGYLDKEIQYDGSDPFIIEMDPVRTVNFSLRKNRQDSIGVSRFMQTGEHAVISIEHRDPDMSQFFTFSKSETFKNKQTLQLLLDDATYDVNIMLFKQLTPEKDVMMGGWIGEWDVSYSDAADAETVLFHAFQAVPIPEADQDFVTMYESMSNRSKYPEVKHEIFRVGESLPGIREDEGGAGSEESGSEEGDES